MTIWDQITRQAHQVLTAPRRGELTPAVTLVQSLHRQLPRHPGGFCSHLPTANKALPLLARYARNGDPNALLMATALLRHPLARIATLADPDGYGDTEPDTRDNATLEAFFTLIRATSDTSQLTADYLCTNTLHRVLGARPKPETPATAIRVDPHSPVLDHVSVDTYDYPTRLLAQARDHGIITALEHKTLTTLYLSSGTLNPAAAARVLGAKTGAVERRAQRAIRKLTTATQLLAAA